MALFEKKDKDKQDLSVVDDYKEPFSWRNFWDDQIIGRYRKIRDFLKEHGVLYFFMSPFQYKSRLILKLVLIFTGIMIGIVPRTVTMINQAKHRNASSEIANAKTTTVNNITVQALMSGQYKKQHVLAFNIIGNTSDGVPSTTSGFDVELSVNRGVSDAKHVYYRYKVLPVDASDRLLIVYVNNVKQQDETGIYNLNVHMKHKKPMPTPIEIVLSNQQKTTALYKGGKIRLSALSDSLTDISNSGATTIAQTEKQLNEKLRIYSVNEERLKESQMTLGMTTEKLKAFIKQYSILPTITDTSTTAQIKDLNPNSPQVPQIVSTITSQGKTYSDADVSNDMESTNDGNNGDMDAQASSAADTVPARDTELPQLTNMIQEIESALGAVNTARLTKYTALKNLENVLNRHLSINEMTHAKTVHDD